MSDKRKNEAGMSALEPMASVIKTKHAKKGSLYKEGNGVTENTQY